MTNPELEPEQLREELPTQINPELIANQFSEIMNLLGTARSETFSNTETNYARELCEWIDSFITFLGDKSRRAEVIAFFESFETQTELSREDLIHFIDLINGLEDTDEEEMNIVESLEPKKWRKVEMLRAVFASFGLLHTENISGTKKTPSNPLINLYHNHVESGGEYSGRLYSDYDALVYFTPDSDQPGHIFTSLKKNLTLRQIPLTLVVTHEVPNEVQAILEESESEEGSSQIQTGEPENAPGSDAKQGRYNRRARAREVKDERLQLASQKLNQEWYEAELERLGALSAFLHERFEELRNHLLENVPYVGEVLDSLSIVEKLKAKGYEIDTLDVNEARRDFARLIDDYRRLIGTKKTGNRKLEQDISHYQGLLPSASGLEEKKLLRKIQRAEGRRNTNAIDILAYESVLAERILESDDLFSQVEGYRISQIPNLEEFRLGFYTSLRAEELYSAPDFIPENMLTAEWIEEHIVPLFVGILGTHLEEYHDVNIRDLALLMEKIDELPEVYAEGISLPDTEGVSQKKIADFFAMILPIIPKDYLTEIPKLPIVVTPENRVESKVAQPKKTKIKKTLSEKRREGSIRKYSLQRSRISLLREIQWKESALMEYELYWREKLRQNIKARMSYHADIEKIDKKIKLRRAHPHKTREDLETLIEDSIKEEAIMRTRIATGELRTNAETYKALLDDRAQLSRKLGRLK